MINSLLTMPAAENKHYDVIVAGVGSMGAAACYHLARRGVRVLGLEQFDIPHAFGSHHGHSRMIRQSYFEHPDYVPLLQRAYELWEALEQESGYELFHQTGGLYLGPSGANILEGCVAAAEAHDLPHEALGHEALRERFPQFRLPDHFEGYYEDRAGFLIPESVMAAHAELALKHGAELRARTPIDHWETRDSGVSVQAGGETFFADHLIVTAGAWTSRLLKNLGIELSVTRQLQAWFWPENPDAFTLENFPVWFIETDSPYGHYGFPMHRGQPGIKIALHKPGEPVEPEEIQEKHEPAVEEIDELRAVLQQFIPEADGPLLSARQCLYTNSPDHHFIIDRHPEHERLTLACGFSGHGFKFASVVGEILADLATSGRTELPAQFLGLERFS
jgi:sarcosine oxidase